MDGVNNNMNMSGWMSKHCRPGTAMCILRLVLGSIFMLHGSQKVFGLFGGPGLDGFIAWIGTYGVPEWLGYAAAFAEFAGGCMMFFGIATELGALLTIPVMAGAVWLVHWDGGYFMQNNGFEYPLNLIFLAIAVIIGGPGCGALWDGCRKWRC